MNEVLQKRNELIKIIKNHHSKSFNFTKTLPKLIAVSKQQPDIKIKQALETGHRLFGENKLQEAIKRWTKLLNVYKDIELHFIGHLQTNKVKKALNFFDVVHTLDRKNLANEISKNLSSSIKTKTFLIQVKTSNEENKSGIYLDDFEKFYEYTQNLKIPVSGLMCLPPVNEDASVHFSKLKELANKFNLNDLSMGMSNDFESAIKFGSTHLRIGSSFFGKRI